ncbi:hypothetical protein ACE6H2_018596 [Prunus campanulata]
MGRGQAKSDYENVRNARILENQARLTSLGLHKTITELRSIASSAKPPKTFVRNYRKKVYELTSLRRSNRLKEITATATATVSKHVSFRRSERLRGKSGSLAGGESEERRPANAPLVDVRKSELQLSSESAAQRCNSKGRGSVYHPVFGIHCHLCRQKKLCGEEDCKRCGNLDMDQPCIGKTDCSVCHSSRGVLCRGCLKVRYGEGQEMGYKSVAHLLMDELKLADKMPSL